MTDPQHLADVADLAVARQAKKSPPRARRLSYKFAGETRPHLEGLYIVKGLIPRGLVVVYGRANAGKTAVALDLVLHVAAR